MTGQKLGELNGVWTWGFRLTTLAMPVLLGVSGWQLRTTIAVLTEQAANRQWMVQTERDRFRREDGLQMEVKLTKDITEIWKAIGELPPPEFRDAVKDLERRVRDLELRIAASLKEHRG